MASAQSSGRRAVTKRPKSPPQHANLRYGKWKRNVLDLWVPESSKPTPLLIYIHGGGFVGGNKERVRTTGDISKALDAGIAFASIHYRFRYPDNDQSDPQRAGLPDILRDAARAVQYLRYRAKDFNLNPTRVACYGGSAGAGTSYWLAVRDDLADPQSIDPVLRQSTRLTAAGLVNGQFTYDLSKWDAAFSRWNGDLMRTHGQQGRLKIHNFLGLSQSEYSRPAGKRARTDVDMLGWITPDDPPIFLVTTTASQDITTKGVYNHHPHHAELIRDCCRENGVEVKCLLPKVQVADAKELKQHPDAMLAFLMGELLSPQP